MKERRERERNKFLSSLEFLLFCSLDLDRDSEFFLKKTIIKKVKLCRDRKREREREVGFLDKERDGFQREREWD